MSEGRLHRWRKIGTARKEAGNGEEQAEEAELGDGELVTGGRLVSVSLQQQDKIVRCHSLDRLNASMINMIKQKTTHYLECE